MSTPAEDLTKAVERRERALFAARHHVRMGTMLSDQAVADVCAELLATEDAAHSARQAGINDEREACAQLVESDVRHDNRGLASLIRSRGIR